MFKWSKHCVTAKWNRVIDPRNSYEIPTGDVDREKRYRNDNDNKEGRE